MSAAQASAQPVSPTVARGAATVATTGSTTIVTQTTSKAVLNWQSLSVAGGSTLRFDQPDVNSITLNRVTGGSASSIDGTISANGQVWVLNPSGVIVGSGGRVQTAGFLATTRNIGDDDFMSGHYAFTGQGTGEIRNAGQIDIENGYAVLAGGKVTNRGLVSARLGTVALIGGQGFTLDLDGDKLLSFAITEPLSVVASDGVISNSGTLATDGGRVLLTARAAADAAASTINSGGLVQARSLEIQNGQIVLDGGANGAVKVTGRLDVSGLGQGQTGGTISVIAKTVDIANGAKLDARGDAGGGSILVGGGPHGAAIAGDASALDVTVEQGASLDASAVGSGNGGVVTLWSDVNNPLSLTRAAGALRADGGATSGDGGFIETSGHMLEINGASGSASAPRGSAGEWLLDPYDIQIVTQPSGSNASEVAAGDIETALNGGTNVTIDTSSPPSQGAAQGAGDITLNTSITKTAGAGATLAFRADNDIVIEPGADISSMSGGLNVTLTAAGTIYLGGDITATGGQSNGLVGTRYAGYFGDNLSFFQTAQVQSDPRFGNLFTAVNTTTPGANFGDNYSVLYFGLFKPSASGTYTFTTSSDDASYLFVGNAGETIASLEARATTRSALAAAPGTHPVVTGSGTVSLTAGNLYPLVVYYGESGGGDQETIRFATPGGSLTDNGSGFYFTNAGGHATFNGNVQLIRDVTVSAQGSVTFNGTVDSGTTFQGLDPQTDKYGLTVSNPVGAVTFNQAVGSNNPVANLSVDATSLTAGLIAAAESGSTHLTIAQESSVTGAIAGGSLVKSGAGQLDWNVGSDADAGVDTVTLDGGTLSLSSQSGLNFSAPISLTADSVLSFHSGPVSLTSTIDGAYNLDIGSDSSMMLNSLIGTTTQPSRLRIESLGALRLGSDADIRSSGDLLLAAGQQFVNDSTSSSVLKSQNSRWLVFSGNSSPTGTGGSDSPPGGAGADNVGVLDRDFTTYGVGFSSPSNLSAFDALGTSLSIPSTGNGFVYSFTPTVSVNASGSVSKTYDGTTAIALPSVTLSGSGALYGDTITGGTVASGIFDSADAGSRNVILSGITLTAHDGNGKPVYGYQPNGTVSLGGTIDPKALTASLTGSLSRTYDGTTGATLDSSNYQLVGLVSGQSITINQTSGTFASPNAGSGIAVSASLAAGDFTGGSGTTLSNYTLPTSAAGLGMITPKALTASYSGSSVEKTYDGTPLATLDPSSIQVSGFVSGESANLNSAIGSYDSADAGQGKVVATMLTADEFTAGQNTLLSNYVLPSFQTTGQIDPKQLMVTITGVSRQYDTTTSVDTSASNYQISGLVSGQSASISRPSATFASSHAGTDIGLTASLQSSDFTAGSGTDLNNYALPASASGTGTITPKQLSVSLTGTVARDYDGTTAAVLASSNYQISGFLNNQGASISQTAGTFASANAGTGINVRAMLGPADLVANSGTIISDYILPASASGNIGTINPKALTASLTGNVQKVYDGTTDATLSSSNYQLVGLANGDSISVNQASGSYSAADAATGIGVAATLATGNFAAGAGTQLSNYILPTNASGAIGTITPRPLTISLTGSISRVYDSTTAATLSSDNYQLAGFVDGQSASVKQTSGTFASADVGSGLSVTASLGGGDYLAGANTLLSNYILPTSATGSIGAITAATLLYVADPATRGVGDPNPTFGGTVTGFSGSDTIGNATTGSLIFTSDADPTSVAGQYAINGGGLSAANYVFQQADSNATALTVDTKMSSTVDNTVQSIVSTVSTIKVPTPPAPTVAPASTAPAPAASGQPSANGTGPSSSAPAPDSTGSSGDSTSSSGSGDSKSSPGGQSSGPSAGGSAGTPTSAAPAGGTAAVNSSAPAAPAAPSAPNPGSGAGGGVAVASVAAAPVAPTPPSPVPQTPPPTPKDAADAGDPILKAAAPERPVGPPPQARRLTFTMTQLSPNIALRVNLPARVRGAPGVDMHYSLSGGGF